MHLTPLPPAGALQGFSAKNGVEALVASRLEDGMLDLTADESREQHRQQRVHHWDARKKKYVTKTMAELAETSQRGAKKLRTESGVTQLGRKSKV